MEEVSASSGSGTAEEGDWVLVVERGTFGGEEEAVAELKVSALVGDMLAAVVVVDGAISTVMGTCGSPITDDDDTTALPIELTAMLLVVVVVVVVFSTTLPL